MYDEYGATNIWSYIQIGLIIVMIVYSWWSKRESAKATELEMLKDKVVKLEEQVKYLPDCKQINRLEIQLTAIDAKLEPLGSRIDFVYKYLYGGKRSNHAKF